MGLGWDEANRGVGSTRRHRRVVEAKDEDRGEFDYTAHVHLRLALVQGGQDQKERL